MSKEHRIILAGGGTGGHIFPAIAIAKAFEEKYPGSKIQFVGARSGMEGQIVPKAGYDLYLINVGKLHSSVGLWVRLKTLILLPIAFLQVLLFLIKFRPTVVLGVGGFASGPCVAVAALLGYPTLIWEPNAFPGMTNRILSRWVKACLVVFVEAQRDLKSKQIVRVGLPVRKSMRSRPREAAAGRPFRVLVTGGSQGARAINQAVVELVQNAGKEWLKTVEILHQAGRLDFARIQEIEKDFAPHVRCFQFIDDMDEKMAWADLLISRSGASTVSEIAACQKASILVPLPTAADDHQTKNAKPLADAGAAIHLPQSELTWQVLQRHIDELKAKPHLIQKMQAMAAQFYTEDAAGKIAEQLVAYEVPVTFL